MQIENNRIESQAVVEEIAIVVNAGIVDQHLHLQAVLFAIVVELFRSRLERKVAHERNYLDCGKFVAKFVCPVVNRLFVGYNEQVVTSGGQNSGVLEADAG